MGLAGAVLFIGAAILLMLGRRRRGSGALSAKPAHPSGTERDTELLKDLQTGHHKGPGLAISSLPREALPPHLPLPIHDPHFPQARAASVLLPPPPVLQDRVRSQKAHRDTVSEATTASADVHSATTTSGGPTVSVTTRSATASAAKPAWAAEISTKTHDTFLDMTQQSRPLEPPGPGAGAEECRQFLHRQLDSLAGREVLQGLLLLQGSSNRLQGGKVFRAHLLLMHASALLLLPAFYKAFPVGVLAYSGSRTDPISHSSYAVHGHACFLVHHATWFPVDIELREHLSSQSCFLPQSSPTECADQVVVQFACHEVSELEYAIKFFLSMAAFKDESEQYTNKDNPLIDFPPRLHALVDNSDGHFKDAFGHAMPPCIVMERGESLDKWVQRNKRKMDMFTCMQV
jgi:hypothetical protein